MSALNIYPPDANDPDFKIWIDTEEMSQDGTCIGVGSTERQALASAANELRKLSRRLEKLRAKAAATR